MSNKNRNTIKRIYLGLPSWFRARVFWVGRNYRTNELSHIQGGSDIIIEFHNEKVFGYDWIKFPSRYVQTIFTRIFSKEDIVFGRLEENEQIELIRAEVSLVYARKYNKNNYKTVAFEKVWGTEDDSLPWVNIEEWERSENKEISTNEKEIRGNAQYRKQQRKIHRASLGLSQFPWLN